MNLPLHCNLLLWTGLKKQKREKKEEKRKKRKEKKENVK